MKKRKVISSIPAKYLDVLYYAFFDVSESTGKYIVHKVESNIKNQGLPTSFQSIKQLKDVNPNMKVIASIVGWKFSPRLYRFGILGNDTEVDAC